MSVLSIYPDQVQTYSSSGVSASADKVGVLDTRMSGLRSEREDIKEIMRDAQD
jgi:tRNA G37 N-methylase TrmD